MSEWGSGSSDLRWWAGTISGSTAPKGAQQMAAVKEKRKVPAAKLSRFGAWRMTNSAKQKVTEPVSMKGRRRPQREEQRSDHVPIHGPQHAPSWVAVAM